MSPLQIALASLLLISCGILLSFRFRAILPEHHLSEDSRYTVELGTQLLGMLTALVLGLMISSAKSVYDTLNTEIRDSAVKIVLLDQLLGRYGPETQEIQQQIRSSVSGALARQWPEEASKLPEIKAAHRTMGLHDIQFSILELAPKSDAKKWLQSQALQLTNDLAQARLLMFEQAHTEMPAPFTYILTFWLMILFFCFGIFAPRNASINVALLTFALSVSGAIFLIHELNHPLSGLIKVSSAPLRSAFAKLAGP